MKRWLALTITLGLSVIVFSTGATELQAVPISSPATQTDGIAVEPLVEYGDSELHAGGEMDCQHICAECINKCGANEHACKKGCAQAADNCCRAYGKRHLGTSACFHCVN